MSKQSIQQTVPHIGVELLLFLLFLLAFSVFPSWCECEWRIFNFFCRIVFFHVPHCGLHTFSHSILIVCWWVSLLICSHHNYFYCSPFFPSLFSLCNRLLYWYWFLCVFGFWFLLFFRSSVVGLSIQFHSIQFNAMRDFCTKDSNMRICINFIVHINSIVV